MRCVFLAATLLIALSAIAQSPRNVVLFITDDQSQADAGCYGNPVVRTPGLDALAADGVRFTRAFCTTPSCSASRSSLLAGKYNHATGQYGHAHSYHHFRSYEDLKTLPSYLSDAGYRTANAGKYHVAPEEVYPFDEFITRDENGDRSPAALARASESFINADAEQPFFLYFCTVEPHRPFKREGSQEIDPADVIVPPFMNDTQRTREELAKYYMSIERADAGLVELTRILKENDCWDNTLILYGSDNGMAFPGAKTNMYDSGLLMPFVVRDPRTERRGEVCNALINYTDIAPSILDYAEHEHPATAFHGRSFLPALSQTNPAGWDTTYASHTFHEITMYYPVRVVRENRFKLTWNIAHDLPFPFASDLHASEVWQEVIETDAKMFGGRTVEAYVHRPEFELYDVQADPNEFENLADDPAHAEELDRLKKKMRKFQEHTKDPWKLKWEYE